MKYTYKLKDETEWWWHPIFDSLEKLRFDAAKVIGNSRYNEIKIAECDIIPLPTIDAKDLLERLNENFYNTEDFEEDPHLYNSVSNKTIEKLEEDLNMVLDKFHESEGIKDKWYCIGKITEETIEKIYCEKK